MVCIYSWVRAVEGHTFLLRVLDPCCSTSLLHHRRCCLRSSEILVLLVFVALRYLLDVCIACDFLSLRLRKISFPAFCLLLLCVAVFLVIKYYEGYSAGVYASSFSMWWWYGNGGPAMPGAVMGVLIMVGQCCCGFCFSFLFCQSNYQYALWMRKMFCGVVAGVG